MKILVLLRHAHRDKIPGEPNNGLSRKGWLQAADTANALLHLKNTEWKNKNLRVLTSPKLRCVETSDPVSNLMGGEAKVDLLLDEAHSHESSSEFVSRIKQFVSKCKKGTADVIIACSHGDWIPEAVRILTDTEVSIRKGAYFELIWNPKSERFTLGRQRDPEINEKAL